VPDDALAALYRGALCKLFVSRWEGFGYPMLEAMACGCPVIASDRSSIAEIAGDAALLVDPEDARAVADGMVLMFDRASERQSLTDRGLRRARDFSLERCARETIDVYRRLARH
jgi:glycosyltransferase involved in cell wall biosynthesis